MLLLCWGSPWPHQSQCCNAETAERLLTQSWHVSSYLLRPLLLLIQQCSILLLTDSLFIRANSCGYYNLGGEPLQEAAIGVGGGYSPFTNACSHNDCLVGLSMCGTPHPGGFCTSCRATRGQWMNWLSIQRSLLVSPPQIRSAGEIDSELAVCWSSIKQHKYCWWPRPRVSKNWGKEVHCSLEPSPGVSSGALLVGQGDQQCCGGLAMSCRWLWATAASQGPWKKIFDTWVWYNHVFADHTITVRGVWRHVSSTGSPLFPKATGDKWGSLCRVFCCHPMNIPEQKCSAPGQRCGTAYQWWVRRCSRCLSQNSYSAIAETRLGVGFLAQFVAWGGPQGTACFYGNTHTISQVVTLLQPKTDTSQPQREAENSVVLSMTIFSSLGVGIQGSELWVCSLVIHCSVFRSETVLEEQSHLSALERIVCNCVLLSSSLWINHSSESKN